MVPKRIGSPVQKFAGKLLEMTLSRKADEIPEGISSDSQYIRGPLS